MAKVNFELFKGKTLGNGRHPIMLRITHNRKNKYIKTKFEAFPDEWNDKAKVINEKYKTHNKLNSIQFENIKNELSKKINLVRDTILDFEKNKPHYSYDDILNVIAAPGKSVSFFDYAQSHINDLRESGKYGNAINYQTMVNVLKSFTDGKDFTLEQIDFKWLNSFEKFHLQKGNSLNGLSVYLRSIRALYNKALKEKIVSNDLYPFGRNGYLIKGSPVIKRAIEKDKIELIKILDLPENTNLWHAKNYFLFSFYCRGMNWIDMALLKLSNINNDRLVYIREKTKRKENAKVFSIKINQQIKDILQFYIKDKKKNDYIFPIVTKADIENQRLEIRNKRGTFNDQLRKIAKMCGFDENLTSYVSRHSWATIGKKNGVDIALISDGLGHSDIHVTQTYLEEFGNDELDKASELIIS